MRVPRPAALSVLLLLALPAAAQAPAPERGPGSVTIVGQGEVERKPDFARIFVSVSTTGESVGEAVAANRAASERALARVATLGVKRDDIQTANFGVYETPPRQNPDGTPRRVPRYTAAHQLRLVSRDIDGIGRLAGELLALEGMTFGSIAWGLDRSDEAQDEARRRAVADARRQAEVLAGAAGVALGRLRSIGESGGGGPMPYEAATMRSAAAAPSVPIVPPASVRFGASVQMSWEIAER